MRDLILSHAKRLVIKIGSSILAAQAGLRLDHVQRLSDEIARLKQEEREIVLVSSGAIVAGIGKLGLKSYPHTLPLKQAAASAGQSRLIHAYETCFQEAGQKIAQVLLTHEDLADRKRFLNARHTLTTLLQLGVIPIVNENDAVSVDEIRFGDNDTLAAQVAHLVDADLFIILSDVDGLFTRDPRHDPEATLISHVTDITPDIERGAGTSQSQESRGGMVTKIEAAKLARQFGVPTLLLNGEIPDLLPSVFAGSEHGTLFFSQGRKLPQPQTLDRLYATVQGTTRAGFRSRHGAHQSREKPAAFRDRRSEGDVCGRRSRFLRGPGRKRVCQRIGEFFIGRRLRDQGASNERDCPGTGHARI